MALTTIVLFNTQQLYSCIVYNLRLKKKKLKSNNK